ncbi:MAG: hypothetical protein QM820_10605 [Minicystis sp.]
MNRLFMRALTALLLAWPPVHMALTEAHGISPWRLGGYGMYSVPHPAGFRIVRAFVRAKGGSCPESPVAGIGTAPPDPVEIYLTRPNGKLFRLERSRALERDSRFVRDFPRAPLARPFVSAVRRRLEDCGVTAEPGIIITVDEQRLDVKRRALHVESRLVFTE